MAPKRASSKAAPSVDEAAKVALLAEKKGKAPADNTHQEAGENEALSKRQCCKENGPRAIWLIEFWCLMNNTIRKLISFLVFVFVVHRMQDLLGLRN
jgi:hypothetical protein